MPGPFGRDQDGCEAMAGAAYRRTLVAAGRRPG